MIYRIITTFGLAVLCLAVLPFSLQAQVPNDVQDFTSHGVHVILRNTNANDVIAVLLGEEGGLAYGETGNATIASYAAEVAAESGSAQYPKELYRDTLAKLSTTIGGSGGFYSSNYSLRTISQNFDRAWSIFSDLVRNPQFDSLEKDKIGAQKIQGIESRTSNPEGYTDFVLDSVWEGPSVLNRASTVDEVNNLSNQDLSAYQKKMLERSRMTLIVVGKVTRQDIENKLADFESVPMGNFHFPTPPVITPQQSKAVMLTRELPTTYVAAHFPSAQLASKDWWPERLMVQILGDRLFNEVRTKRNLSYAPNAYATGSHNNYYGDISLQSVLPDSATNVTLREVRKLQTTLIPKRELEDAKKGRITVAYYIMQTNLAQAQALYNYQIESGDWRNLFRIVPETNRVTAQQIKDVANKYLHGFTFVTMGPEGKATQSVYTFE